MVKEFSHIEVCIVRNPAWLKPHEQRRFFLSESFPVADFELPAKFQDMTENDLEEFINWFIALIPAPLTLRQTEVS